MDKKRSIIGVITGMEHSGTTYLSNILNSHSMIMSGFECGILLENLAHFETVEPFSEWLKAGNLHFGLPHDYLEKIKTMNYEQVYEYIGKTKGSHIDNDYQLLIRKVPYFVDKTPQYIYYLPKICQKVKDLQIPI